MKKKICHVLGQISTFIIKSCKENCFKIHLYEKKIWEKGNAVFFNSNLVSSLYHVCNCRYVFSYVGQFFGGKKFIIKEPSILIIFKTLKN